MVQYHSVEFHDFCFTQNLHKINFEDSRAAKSAILTYLEALKLDYYEILHFWKVKIDQKSKFRVSIIAKNGIF